MDHMTDKRQNLRMELSPEMPYESRFFSVLIGEDGQVIATDTGKIAAVDMAAAQEMAQSVWQSQKPRGSLANYRYVRQEEDSLTRVIFLDYSRSMTTFRVFLATSCGISLLGMLAVFVLLQLFSGRIIQPVAESYEKQKQFITDAGHELKTPLTIIEADAEVLAMEHGQNDWVQDIQTQTKRLTALTNDLVSLARMEEDQPKLQRIEFPLSDLVEETVQSFQTLATVQGKRFTSTIQPMLSFRGDEKAIRQLLSILLDNALKYSDQGGEVRLTLEQQKKAIRLTVFNTTADPVTREQLSHLFDRFYRADQSRSSSTGGYGIGLSIARAVVNVHKGKITADTSDGHSLSVQVTLPAGKETHTP
jgi:signal transduction histidine kinase